MKDRLIIRAYELLIENLETQRKDLDDTYGHQNLIYHTALRVYEEAIFQALGYKALHKLATEADKRIEKEFGEKEWGIAECVEENFLHKSRPDHE